MVFILFFALILRWYGIDWDHGWHLHPDERMLIMVADRIQLFSQMNPDFFNYGSLPVYILKGVTQLIDAVAKTHLATYDGMLSVGRGISVTLDLLILMLVYKTSMLIFDSKKTALLGSLMYAIAFFPIQNTHFFIVDNFLNFFMAVVVYLILSHIRSPHKIKIFFLAVATAAAVTTKATGVILLAAVGLTLLLPKHKQKFPPYLLNTILTILFFGISFASLTYLFMPYAFSPSWNLASIMRNPLDIFNPKLINDITLQTKMNSDPFIFPYTLQYVMTKPYIYYVKNIFIWGLGPFISISAIFGFLLYVLTIKKAVMKHHGFGSSIRKLFSKLVHRTPSAFQVRDAHGLTPYYVLLATIYILFYIFYFLVIGRSAVKFMRYMLPLYAPLCVLAGFALFEFLTYFHKTSHGPTPLQIKIKPFFNIIGMILLFGAMIWTLMFEHIYTNEHTRIAASKWIFQHIRSGSKIAVEHWDDRLPLPLNEYNYQFNELTLYDPDTPEKWLTINSLLKNSDYLILASNRLYTPLPKLTDCEKLPPNRCYKETANYYRRLFRGELGFKIEAVFSSYPQLQIGTFTLEMPDDNADESFTVYDHPKIIIFKKK